MAFDASISPALHDSSVLMAGFLLQHFMAFCASISPALHETSVLMAGYLQLVALFSSRLVCLYKSRMCAISDLLAGFLQHVALFLMAFYAYHTSRIASGISADGGLFATSCSFLYGLLCLL